MDCTIYCDTAGIERPQCKRPWPLLSYHGQQYDTEGRPLYYASLYDAASGVGFGQGAVGEKVSTHPESHSALISILITLTPAQF